MLMYIIEQILVLILFFIISFLLFASLAGVFVYQKERHKRIFAYIRLSLFMCCLFAVSYFYLKNFSFGLNAFLLFLGLVYIEDVDKNYEQFPYLLCGLPCGLFVLQNVFFITIWVSLLLMLLKINPETLFFLFTAQSGEIDAQLMVRGVGKFHGNQIFDLETAHKAVIAELKVKMQHYLRPLEGIFEEKGITQDAQRRAELFSEIRRASSSIYDGESVKEIVEKARLKNIKNAQVFKKIFSGSTLHAIHISNKTINEAADNLENNQVHLLDRVRDATKTSIVIPFLAQEFHLTPSQTKDILIDQINQQSIVNLALEKGFLKETKISAAKLTKEIIANETPKGLTNEKTAIRGENYAREVFGDHYEEGKKQHETKIVKVDDTRTAEYLAFALYTTITGEPPENFERNPGYENLNKAVDFVSKETGTVVCVKQMNYFPSNRNFSEDYMQEFFRRRIASKDDNCWQDILHNNLTKIDTNKTIFMIDLTDAENACGHAFNSREELVEFVEQNAARAIKEKIQQYDLKVFIVFGSKTPDYYPLKIK